MNHRFKQPNESDEPVAYGNAVVPVLGLVVIVVLACTAWALGLDQTARGASLSRCAAITPDTVRLACFDKLAEPRQPPRGALAILRNKPDETTQ